MKLLKLLSAVIFITGATAATVPRADTNSTDVDPNSGSENIFCSQCGAIFADNYSTCLKWPGQTNIMCQQFANVKVCEFDPQCVTCSSFYQCAWPI